MKSRKKKVLSWMVAVVLIGFGAAHARSESIVDDWNWADSVAGYSANIQNYGGTVMSGSTTWWLTGPPDADVDGNGYVWDDCDQDSVAGWRAGDANQYITMYWKDGIADVAGRT